jgi:hypothetical protein
MKGANILKHLLYLTYMYANFYYNFFFEKNYSEILEPDMKGVALIWRARIAQSA